MYKKCDIIETRTFSFDKTREFTDKMDVDLLNNSNWVYEIIEKEVHRLRNELDTKLDKELKAHGIKTRKPKYLKGWLTRKRLLVHMIVDGLDTTVRIVSKDKPLCGRGEVIKAGLKATSLVGMSDCILKVTERAYNNVSVSDRIYIEQSANIRRIDIKIVKE
jgi:hypothetical protein